MAAIYPFRESFELKFESTDETALFLGNGVCADRSGNRLI